MEGLQDYHHSRETVIEQTVARVAPDKAFFTNRHSIVCSSFAKVIRPLSDLTSSRGSPFFGHFITQVHIMTSVLASPASYASHQVVPPNQQPLSGRPSNSPAKLASSSPNSGPEHRVHRGTVRATLNFYRPPQDGSAPYNYVETPPPGDPSRNFSDFDAQVPINDARGQESSFSLDKQAFATLQGHPHNGAIDWNDDKSIKSHYYPEVESILLENVPGAKRVLLFDHTIRRAVPGANRSPVNRTHIDQTPYSAKQRVNHHLPEEAGKLLQGRYWIINVWRPLNGAVESFPLAFADSATVPDADMVGVEHRYPDRTGETAAIKYNKDHRWYYWSGVKDDERILLQCFDSANPGNRAPHSAFEDPRSTTESKPRESIEVRALVFD